jgi:hypothetical protein
LPAILYGAPSWLRRAVPPGSLVTPIMPLMITSQYFGSETVTGGSGLGSIGTIWPVCASRTRLTSRGAQRSPRIAIVAAA